MKESVGYTVTLNIIITFIIIIFTFISAALIYFKSNKVSNIITDAIEKYEGYNSLSDKEMAVKLASVGYNKSNIKCATSVNSSEKNKTKCSLIRTLPNATSANAGKNGYCVYLCNEGEYYYYKIRTNMMINIPIINNILNIPIYSNTNRLFDFENNLK